MSPAGRRWRKVQRNSLPRPAHKVQPPSVAIPIMAIARCRKRRVEAALLEDSRMLPKYKLPPCPNCGVTGGSSIKFRTVAKDRGCVMLGRLRSVSLSDFGLSIKTGTQRRYCSILGVLAGPTV